MELCQTTGLFEDSFLVDKIRELWLQNLSSTTILCVLKHHTYDLSLLQLCNLRLRNNVLILFQNQTNLMKEEALNIADEAITKTLKSGQSLRWSAGSDTIANI